MMECDEMGWDVIGWVNMECHGGGWDNMVWYGMVWEACSTIEVHPNFSEAPHLRSSIPHPKTDLSKNQIAAR